MNIIDQLLADPQVLAAFVGYEFPYMLPPETNPRYTWDARAGRIITALLTALGRVSDAEVLEVNLAEMTQQRDSVRREAIAEKRERIKKLVAVVREFQAARFTAYQPYRIRMHGLRFLNATEALAAYDLAPFTTEGE